MAMDLIVTKYAVAMVTTTTINHACRQLHLGFEVNLMYNVHMIVMSSMSSVPMTGASHGEIMGFDGESWLLQLGYIEVTIQH